jgi:putative transposase
MLDAKELTNMRILAYCIMPNHFHFVLYPRTDGDLGVFMGWLTTTHVRQYRTRTESVGDGHLYQDRYKSFPIETNEYATTLIRYVEQNPLRARMVERAEDWRWSSLWRREKGSEKERKLLDPLPVELPVDYLQSVNMIFLEEDLTSIRYSVNKGAPYGSSSWTECAIERFNLGHTLRNSGRPKR